MTNINILQADPEHPFAKYVRILGKGKKGSRSLTEQEAFDAMDMILSNQVEDIQLGAFLMLLRVKEESPEELSGFVKAVKKHCLPTQHFQVDLDWSSYAGKRRHLPWFLFSIILLREAGYRTFIHGASGHTQNRLYTESALEHLGFKIAEDWQDASDIIDKEGFVYMPLKHISAKLSDMINLRNLMGLRSPVHSLSRLINPLDAPLVLQGIFHPPYSELHQKAGRLLNYQRIAVLKGDGGEIERNPDSSSIIRWSTQNEMGQEEWPAYFPKRHLKPMELSLDRMKSVWNKEIDDEYAEGAIVCTCALALKHLQPDLSQSQAISKSKKLWQQRSLKFN